MIHKCCNTSDPYPAYKTRLEQQLIVVLRLSKIHIAGWEAYLAQCFSFEVEVHCLQEVTVLSGYFSSLKYPESVSVHKN